MGPDGCATKFSVQLSAVDSMVLVEREFHYFSLGIAATIARYFEPPGANLVMPLAFDIRPCLQSFMAIAAFAKALVW